MFVNSLDIYEFLSLSYFFDTAFKQMGTLSILHKAMWLIANASVPEYKVTSPRLSYLSRITFFWHKEQLRHAYSGYDIYSTFFFWCG